jgi:hypothetical protein
MNCMTFGGVGVRVAWLFVGSPSTHSMSGLTLARHVHNTVGHAHWSNHCQSVLSWGLEL